VKSDYLTIFVSICIDDMLLLLVIVLLVQLVDGCCRQWISLHRQCLTGSRLLKAVTSTSDSSTEVLVSSISLSCYVYNFQLLAEVVTGRYI